MENKVVKLESASESEVLEVLRQFGAKCVDTCRIDGSVILEVFEAYMKPEEGRFERRSSFPKMPPGMLGMMVPTTRYWVSVRTTTLTAVCTILDILFAGGAATATAGLSGSIKQAIRLLDDKTGEICVLQVASEIQPPLPSTTKLTPFVLRTMGNQACRNPSFECSHRKGAMCGISRSAVGENIKGLIGKEILGAAPDGSLRVHW